MNWAMKSAELIGLSSKTKFEILSHQNKHRKSDPIEIQPATSVPKTKQKQVRFNSALYTDKKRTNERLFAYAIDICNYFFFAKTLRAQNFVFIELVYLKT
jgi:hypothetical protein